MNIDQLKILFANDPEIMSLLNDRGKDRLQALIDLLRKGDKGDMPVKGTDYWTQDELDELKAEILEAATPVKGEDYFDGDKGLKGDKGDKGDQGKPGRDGEDGRPGKDGVDGDDGKDAELPDMEEVLAPINKKIDTGMARVDGRIKLIDQRWKGSGIGEAPTDDKVYSRRDKQWVEEITVSAIAPPNPYLHMLWYDIS